LFRDSFIANFLDMLEISRITLFRNFFDFDIFNQDSIDNSPEDTEKGATEDKVVSDINLEIARIGGLGHLTS
jgi:hypothetical protein